MNPSGGFGGGFFSPGLGAPAASTAPAPAQPQAPTGAFSFGTPASSAAPTSIASSAAAPAFGSGTAYPSFGTGAAVGVGLGTAASTASSLSFGASAAPTGAFSFGTPASTAATSAPAPAPSLAPQPTAAVASAPPPSFGASNTLSFGTPAAKPALPTFGAATQQTNTSTQQTNLSAAVNTANPSLTGPSIGFGSSTTTTQSTGVVPGNQMTFSQIEEMINKYTSELEEQEKLFINQATQVNSWDNLLNKNSKKIVELSNAVEKVKSEQKCLEDELKFIETQHTELEEFIAPLKKDVDKIPHSDLEKAQTYSLAENLDTQLRQMSEDLKEVIEHLNEVSKLQNSNDPIVQIGRILNAHMTSLQWIELSTSQINSKLEEINKLYDTLRRDTERSLRLTYCD